MRAHPSNLVRYRHHRYVAWVVRILRRGRHVVRYFADRSYGGGEKAYEAARAFRDKQIEKLPPMVFAGLRARSATRVVGVTIQVDRKPQGVYRAYVASWPEGDGRRARSFAFAKYGKTRAFELAVRARRTGLAGYLRATPKTRPLNRRRRRSQDDGGP